MYVIFEQMARAEARDRQAEARRERQRVLALRRLRAVRQVARAEARARRARAALVAVERRAVP